MGNGIAVILLVNDQTKFDKRLSTRGISRTAYLGRLIHTLSTMIDIIIIEEESDEESEFDEDESDGSDRLGLVVESIESDTTKSEDFGIQDHDSESSDCQVAERCKDIRTGPGESVESTKCGGDHDRVQNMYSEYESSDCPVAERCENIRNGLGESEEATICGDEDRLQNMYTEFESTNCQMTERCKDERNRSDGQGLGESEVTKSGDFSNMYCEPESSDCQMDKGCCSQDEMNTVVTIDETDSMIS